jgi:hypothetical protein
VSDWRALRHSRFHPTPGFVAVTERAGRAAPISAQELVHSGHPEAELARHDDGAPGLRGEHQATLRECPHPGARDLPAIGLAQIDQKREIRFHIRALLELVRESCELSIPESPAHPENHDAGSPTIDK